MNHPLRALIHEQRLVQADLGYLTGLHESEVSRFLKGKLRATPKRLKAVEKALCAAVDKLLAVRQTALTRRGR